MNVETIPILRTVSKQLCPNDTVAYCETKHGYEHVAFEELQDNEFDIYMNLQEDSLKPLATRFYAAQGVYTNPMTEVADQGDKKSDATISFMQSTNKVGKSLDSVVPRFCAGYPGGTQSKKSVSAMGIEVDGSADDRTFEDATTRVYKDGDTSEEVQAACTQHCYSVQRTLTVRGHDRDLWDILQEAEEQESGTTDSSTASMDTRDTQVHTVKITQSAAKQSEPDSEVEALLSKTVEPTKLSTQEYLRYFAAQPEPSDGLPSLCTTEVTYPKLQCNKVTVVNHQFPHDVELKTHEEKQLGNLDYYSGVNVALKNTFDDEKDVSFVCGQMNMHQSAALPITPEVNSWFKKCLINFSRDTEVMGEVMGQSLRVLFDSGAGRSMINERVFTKYPELNKLPRIKIPPRRITVANGAVVSKITECVRLAVRIQGHQFFIIPLIVPMADTLDLMFGTKEHLEGEVVLNYPTGQVEIGNRSIPLFPTENVDLLPGHSRYITFEMKDAPKHFRNATNAIVYADVTREMPETQYLNYLATVRKRQVYLYIENHSDTPWLFRKGVSRFYLDMRSVGYYMLARDSMDQYTLSKHTFNATKLVFENPPMEDADPEPPDLIESDESDEEDDVGTSDYSNNAVLQEPEERPRKARQGEDPFPWLEAEDPRRSMSDAELIRSTIDLSKSILDKREQKAFYKVLERYREAFSLRDEIGLCPNMEVKLNLHDVTPFFIRPYPIAEDQKKHVEAEMLRGVRLGILKVGQTSYSSPIMLIPRKQGQIPRVVTDFRHLNTRLVKMTASIPLMRDAIQTLGASDCEVISVIDLRDAYHTLRLAKESQKYCGITPFHGSHTYLYQRLGMGLAVSPAIWQNFINTVLDKIPSRKHHMAIMDDCLVHSKLTDHTQHLIQLFKALIRNGLKISPRKCQFFRKDLVYMGHNIMIKGNRPCIKALKDRADAIRKLNQPKTPRDCKSFCGMINFLSMYLKGLQELLAPIYALTKKGAKFEWTQTHQDNFMKLKEMVCKAPVLYMPTADGKFHLFSDTSIVGCGAALYQEQGDQLRLVGFSSKKLPEAVSRYGISELELCGLACNIVSFRTLLEHRDFAAYVDHEALPRIAKAKREPTTNRIKRFLEVLMNYSFTLHFKKGKDMFVSDFLSRHPDNDLHDEHEIVPISFNMITRSKAKAQGIDVPALFEPQREKQLQRREQTLEDIPEEEVEEVEVQPQPTPLPQPLVPQPQAPKPFIPRIHPSAILPPDYIPKKIPQLVVPKQPSILSKIPLPKAEIYTNPLEGSWDKNLLQKFPHVEPLEVPPLEPETPILKTFSKSQVFRKHLPQQVDIEQMLAELKKRVIHDYTLPLDVKEFRAAYQDDAYLGPIQKYVEKNRCTLPPRAAKVFKSECDNFVSVDGFLFKTTHIQDESRLVLCVPEKFIPQVLFQYHNMILSGHQGYLKMYNTIRQKFYFYNMGTIIRDYIQACHTCQSRKPKEADKATTYLRIPLHYRPMTRISMDVKTMVPSTHGHKYLLLCTCELTNYVVGIPLLDQTTESLFEAIYQRIICEHGPPHVVITDQGSGFTSNHMARLFKAFGIRHYMVLPKHHQSNKTERSIQSISNIIMKYLSETGTDWPVYVQSACYAMNTFVSPTLGFSPWHMVKHYEAPSPMNIELDLDDNLQLVTPAEYLHFFDVRIRNLKQQVLERMYVARHKDQMQADRLHPDTTDFKPGDLVFLDLEYASKQAKIPSKKLNKQTWVGPLKIVKMLDSIHYMVADWDDKITPAVIPKTKLKPYYFNLGVTYDYRIVAPNTVEKLLSAVKQLYPQINALMPQKVSDGQTDTKTSGV